MQLVVVPAWFLPNVGRHAPCSDNRQTHPEQVVEMENEDHDVGHALTLFEEARPHSTFDC